jgi:HK97 family phage major capsid protein
MIDTKQMRADRAALIEKAQGLYKTAMDAKRSLTGEEQGQIDKILADEKVMIANITNIEALNDAERSVNAVRSQIGREDFKPETDKKPDASKEQQKELDAYRSYLTHGLELDGLRSLTIAETSGYTVPMLAMGSYQEALANFTDIRQAPVNVMTTATGSELPIPTFDDTASDADETAEGDDVGDADDIIAGQISLKSYMVTTGVLKVSEQFIRDSAIDAVGYTNMKLGERLARRHNKRFTTGTGTNQAKGFVPAATIGKTLGAGHGAAIGIGADAGAVAKDMRSSLNGLVASVTRPYRQVGKTGFAMNDNTALHLKDYVDSTGRGLWVPSLTEGDADRLLGYPVWINNDMADIAANSLPIAFGNWSYFSIRYVGGMLIKRFNERYGEKLMIGFLGYQAIDSNLLDTGALKTLKMSA